MTTLPSGTSSDPIRIRGKGPEDAIATVWYQLGYRPSRSLVLIGLTGDGRRLGMIARSDLPDSLAGAEPATRRAVVAGLFQPIEATGTREVLAIVFSDRLFGHGKAPITASLIRSEVEARGGSVLDVIGVTAQRYRSLICRAEECCPRAGRSLAEVESSTAAMAHVLLGAEVMPSERDLLRDVEPDPSRRERPGPSNRRPLNPGSRRLQWLVWERAFGAGEIAEGRAASLAPYLADPHLRDAVLVGALGMPRESVLESLRRSGPDGEPEAALDLFQVVVCPPEDPAQRVRVDRAKAVLATAAKHAAPGERGDALAVLAIIAWYEGQAARARLLVEAALLDRPGQSLAVLVGDILAAAVPPPWLAGARASRGAIDRQGA